MKLQSVWVTIILIGLIICSYQPKPAHFQFELKDWTYSDLIALDPSDALPPTQDVIALYSRNMDDELQIRIDFLDVSQVLDYDLFLFIDTKPGGSHALPILGMDNYSLQIEWDYFIVIYASGSIFVIQSDGTTLPNLKVHVFRDTLLDNVVVSFDKSRISIALLNVNYQLLIKDSASSRIADEIVVENEGFPPPPIPILIAFWNTFKAQTPAQALRSWDGAHAGPSSSRHGLGNLLNAIEKTDLPVFLFDLKTPYNLSILDYMGEITKIIELANLGLVILPDSATIGAEMQITGSYPYLPPLDIVQYATTWNRKIAANFGISTGQLIGLDWSIRNVEAGGLIDLYWNCRLDLGLFGDSCLMGNDYAQFQIPNTSEGQATTQGLSTETVRTIINSGFSNAASTPIMLGGDLSTSSWGEPKAAKNALLYIAGHPWMKVLNLMDLLDQKTKHPAPPLPTPLVKTYIPYTNQGDHFPSNLTAEQIQDRILEELNSTPKNTLRDLAWQTYLGMISIADPSTYDLRVNYLGLIGHILAAAHWAENPRELSDCQVDLDWDGQYECILATPELFATFELSGGYLAFLFHRSSDMVDQVIAPTAELSVGLSDPSSWVFQNGILADSAQVPGAFIGNNDIKMNYYAFNEGIKLTLLSDDMAIRKTYEIGDRKLSVRVENQNGLPLDLKIPLIVNPWRMYQAGWGDSYMLVQTQAGWSWSISGGPTIEINSTSPLSIIAFNASRSYLSAPEDPNFDYTLGHFLPFPLALADLQGSSTTTTITVVP